MSIELDNINSGYNLQKINSNFQKVETYINDKVLHRAETGVAGEAMMERDLDMNGHEILNYPVDVTNPSSLVTKQYVDNADAVLQNQINSSVRVPEGSVNKTPTVFGRAGKLFAWDSLGQPIAVHSETDDGTQLEIDLAGADGFKYIGSVPSYDQLKTITPSYAQQRILLKSYYADGLTGGGVFRAIAGSAVEDGGHICVPTTTTGWYWERVSEDVNLFDYGIYLQTVTVARTSAAVNMAGKMQAAINRAVARNVPLTSPFNFDQNPSYFQNGIVLFSSIDITGLKVANGEFPLYANNLLGSYSTDLGLSTALSTPEPFVLFCKNATFNSTTGYKTYGSNFRGIKWGSWCIRNVGDRTTHLNGIIAIFCHAVIDRLRAVNFKGNAVNLGSSYDYELGELGQEMSGDVNYYAIDAQTYPAADSYDEHNAYTIHGVLSHFGYDRGVRITGSKGIVGRVHDEGLFVTTSAPFAGYSFDYGTDGGLGYTNNFIGGVGSTVGEYSCDPAATNTIDSNLLVGCWGNNIGTVYTSRLSSVVFHPAGTAGCQVGVLRTTGNLRINSGARTVIDSIVMSGSVNMLDASSRILRGNVAGGFSNLYGYMGYGTSGADIQLRSTGVLDSVTVTGAINCNQGASGTSKIESCTATSLGFLSTGTGSTYISNSTITGNITTVNSTSLYGHRVTVGTSLAVTGTNLNINFTGKSNFQNITFTTGATGLWAFDIGTVVFSSGVTNWIAPTAAPRSGTTTTRPDTGLTLMYTGSSWKTFVAAPV